MARLGPAHQPLGLARHLDNGPQHRSPSTVLTLQRCRIYSRRAARRGPDAAQLCRPRCRMAAGAAPSCPSWPRCFASNRWQARHGIADLDVHLRGLLPAPGDRRRPPRSASGPCRCAARHAAQASFVLLDRGADISELNVRVGLRDSLWQLTNASGVLDKMRFKASATTVLFARLPQWAALHSQH
jgi:hypothetical protein